jgi:hypothetical protein
MFILLPQHSGGSLASRRRLAAAFRFPNGLMGLFRAKALRQLCFRGTRMLSLSRTLCCARQRLLKMVLHMGFSRQTQPRKHVSSRPRLIMRDVGQTIFLS